MYAAGTSLWILVHWGTRETVASTGQLLLILVLPTRPTSVSIVLTSTHRTTTIDPSVSRCANVRGGYIGLHTGSLRSAGLDRHYWSTTTYPNATYAYYLNFNSTNVYPSDYSSRFYGFSVCCVVFSSTFFLFLPSPFLTSILLLLSSFSFFLLLPPIHYLTNWSFWAEIFQITARTIKWGIRFGISHREEDNVWEREGRRKIKSKRRQKTTYSQYNFLNPSLILAKSSSSNSPILL